MSSSSQTLFVFALAQALTDFLLGPSGSTLSLGVVRDGLELLFRVTRGNPEADGSYAYKSPVGTDDVVGITKSPQGQVGKDEAAGITKSVTTPHHRQQALTLSALAPSKHERSGCHYTKAPTSLSLASQLRLSELSQTHQHDDTGSPDTIARGGQRPAGDDGVGSEKEESRARSRGGAGASQISFEISSPSEEQARSGEENGSSEGGVVESKWWGRGARVARDHDKWKVPSSVMRAFNLGCLRSPGKPAL
jgi:hypothetical protein